MSLTVLVRVKNQSTKKKFEEKILGRIELPETMERFVFGRNDQTKNLCPSIKDYDIFISKKQGTFQKTPKGKGYLYTDTSEKGTFLRRNFKILFWNIKGLEARLEKGVPTGIQVGDNLVCKWPQANIEIILEVIKIA